MITRLRNWWRTRNARFVCVSCGLYADGHTGRRWLAQHQCRAVWLTDTIELGST